MYTKSIVAAALIGLAHAQDYTTPKSATFGSLYTPDLTHPVTQGETFQVTWDATGHTTDGSTISLVLCKGPGSNCVNAPNAIVTGVSAAKQSYDWAVPCNLTPGVKQTETGYGMLIIVDGTGEFQYSTQFSVLAGSKCGGSPDGNSTATYTDSSSTWATWKTSTTSSYSAPNNYTHTSYTSQHYSTHATSKATVPAGPTTLVVPTPATSTPAASPSPSKFLGAANKVGGSAAALAMAAGAAFLAL